MRLLDIGKMTKRPVLWIAAAAVAGALVLGVVWLSSDSASEDGGAAGADATVAGDIGEGDGIDLDSEGATKAADADDGDADPTGGGSGGSAPTDGGGEAAADADGSSEGADDDALVPGDDGERTPRDGVAEGETSLTAVAFLDDLDLARPQTYRVELIVLGRQDAGGGLVYAQVETAELLGPIDASSGEPMGDPDPDEPDHARRVETLTILATATEDALGEMTVGQAETVYLVLLPVQDGATLHVDRVL